MISIRGILLVIIFIVCLSGMWRMLFYKELNHCEMTYMYQPPEYVRISTATFSRPYKLYSYGEGTYAQTLYHNEYYGIPVLFIPGNGGSHMQVRSLASVALVMSYTSLYGRHFNYFTIDFNEELSGFDGEKLDAQTKFLFLSIKRILSLYPPSINIKLILVGHSLGGIVAKGLLTRSYFKPFLERITLLVTLATPHKNPPIVFDLKTKNYYSETNLKFVQQRNTTLKNINIVSIGGGNDDKLVREDLISLQSQYKFDRSILTTGIANVWIGADHLCIVWCRQLTIKLNKLFYNLVEKDAISTSMNQFNLINSTEERQRIIDYHLLKPFKNNNENDKYSDTLGIIYDNINTQWIEHKDQRLIRLNHSRIVEYKNHMIPLKFRESIVILFEGQYKPDMFSVCKQSFINSNAVCEGNGLSLENHTTIVPSSLRSTADQLARYQLKIRSNEYLDEDYTHLIVQLTPTSSSIFILIDRFTTSLRNYDLEMPSILTSVFYGSQNVFEKFVSQENHYYKLILKNFDNIWQSYSLSIITTTCYRSNSAIIGYGQIHKPNVELSEYFWKISTIKYSSLNMTLLRNNNNNNDNNIIDVNNHSNINISLYLEPNCGFRIIAKYSITSSIAQIFRHYTSLLILIGISTVMLIVGIMLFNPLLIFAIQNREYSNFIKNLSKLNQCQRAMEEKCCVIFMNIFQVMTSGRYFLYFYTQIILYIFSCLFLSDFFSFSEDLILLQKQSFVSILTQITVLFMFSYSIIFVFSAIVHHLSNNFSGTFNVFARKMKFFSFIIEWRIFQAFFRLNWTAIYAGVCLFFFGLLFFSFFQANFYLVHMLFTMLMLFRFITLNYSETRLGRTTSTSYIRSIYPVIYGLQLITVILHIPETIDIFPLVLSGKRFETFEWILFSLSSIVESLFYIFFYFVLLLFPMKMDVKLENVYFPNSLRKLAFIIIIIGAFLNILLGSISLRFINLSIFVIFKIILLHKFILYRLFNNIRIKNE